MKRARPLLIPALTLTIGLVTSALTACSSSDDATCMDEGVVVEILDNHRPSGGDHELTIPTADVAAGEEQTYDIRGDNTGHTHTVTVTDEDFASLQDGDPVTIVSSDLGAAGNDHTHEVRLSCP